MSKLIARINRKLVDRDEVLRKCPETSRHHAEVGDFYLVNTSINAIVDKHVDPADLARELGVSTAA